MCYCYTAVLFQRNIEFEARRTSLFRDLATSCSFTSKGAFRCLRQWHSEDIFPRRCTGLSCAISRRWPETTLYCGSVSGEFMATLRMGKMEADSKASKSL